MKGVARKQEFHRRGVCTRRLERGAGIVLTVFRRNFRTGKKWSGVLPERLLKWGSKRRG